MFFFFFQLTFCVIEHKRPRSFILTTFSASPISQPTHVTSIAYYWLLFQFFPFPNPPTWLVTTLSAQMLLLSLLPLFLHHFTFWDIFSSSRLLLLPFCFASHTFFASSCSSIFFSTSLSHGWEGQIVRDDRETRSYKCENEIWMREWEGFLVI